MVTVCINLENIFGGKTFLISSENIIHYKRTGCINVMRQSACLVVNPITVNNFAGVFNCTTAGRASDLMKAPA